MTIARRPWMLLGLASPLRVPAAGDDAALLREALARAHALRDQAMRGGDQPSGAVVWLGGRIVGEAPSRVLTLRDPDAHAEREALRDAQQRLQRADLAGALLVSSSRPCALCESAAARAGIARMVHGDGIDAGAPRVR
jgi:tRNA(Arg) A34 adenosine deaminase TadA